MKYEYATVSEAINELSEKGYKTDFNLESNQAKFENGEWNKKDFKITSVYRYEGNTDPADESVVYAIESNSGIKGVFVSGYGMSSSKGAMKIQDLIINSS